MDIIWHKTDLNIYLVSDKWLARDALVILAGFDPDARTWEPSFAPGLDYPEILEKYRHRYGFLLIPTLFQMKRWWDRWDLLDESIIDILDNALELRDNLIKIWDRSEYGQYHQNSPKFYIDYFLNKGVEPPWLDWAKEEGYYSEDDKNNNIKALEFPEDKYPSELHIANMAYEKAIKDNSSGTPKQKIQKYLKENHPKLSSEATERISVVANWNQSPGAPKKY